MDNLNIAVLASTSPGVREKLDGCLLHELSCDDELSKELEQMDAFVLDQNKDDESISDTIELIKRIRANPYTYLKPVFCTYQGFEDYGLEYLVSKDQIRKFVDMINHEISTVEQITKNISSVANDWQARFLIYFYTRRSIRTLRPVKDKSKKTYYSYPLISIFAIDDEFDYYEWIKELKDRDILTVKRFVKSYFCCSNCSSAHGLFSERCPECHSEDVLLADFLHCYTCGNIAPEAEFITTDDELVCKQCKTKLKHIGHDYDRPLESYSCRSCDSVFMEPEVITECVDCGTITLTEDMHKQKVSEYELTDKAKNYIRMNLLEYSLSIFDDINYIATEFYYTLVDWAYSMQNRNPAYEFSLLHITLYDYLSIADVSLLSKTLRDVLRRTDMLTRVSERNIWIYLPSTSLEGANTVADKLKAIHTIENNSIENAVDILVYDSRNLQEYTTAEKFLKRLSSKG